MGAFLDGGALSGGCLAWPAGEVTFAVSMQSVVKMKRRPNENQADYRLLISGSRVGEEWLARYAFHNALIQIYFQK